MESAAFPSLLSSVGLFSSGARGFAMKAGGSSAGADGDCLASAVFVGDKDEWVDEWVDEKHFEEIDSTQTFVEREYANFDQARLTAVSADVQAAGRGTNDRRWEGGRASSVLMTFFFRFPSECATTFVNRNAPNVTKVLSLAVVDTLRRAVDGIAASGSTPPSFNIKWPNDVVVDGSRKIAGVLARAVPSQARGTGIRLDGIIVGVGVNINQTQQDLDAIVRPVWPATSLRAELGRLQGSQSGVPPLDLDAIRRQLVRSFARELREFFVGGFAAVRDRVNALEVLMGTEVRFRISEAEEVDGIFSGVDEDGQIVLRLPSGELKPFPSGEIIPKATQ